MTKVQLQYSTEPKRRTKRAIIILVVTSFLLIGSLFLVQALEPIIRWRIPFLRAQSACMNWVGPGKIAYCEDPIEARQLALGDKSGTEFTSLTDRDNRVLGYYSMAGILGELHYPESGFQMADQRDGVLFLHSRRAKDGDARLVCVRVSNFFPLRYAGRRSMAFWDQAGLEFTIVQPATLNVPPKILTHLTWSDPTFGDETPKPTRIFFGVPDPVDESKFSILFQTPTEAKVIQGRLMPDDTLQFEVVAGPDSMVPRSATTHP
jgi:hypothetical protein